MAILVRNGYGGLLVLTLGFLTTSLKNVLASSEYGYTLKMPLGSVPMNGERAKRSLATICVEIKPNGPLEEPYYMCKGADFPPFPKFPGAANTVTTSFGNTAATSDYKGATLNNGGGSESGANFHSYTNQFNTAKGTIQSGHTQLETQTSVNQHGKQTTNTDAPNNQLQSNFHAGENGKIFLEQTTTGQLFQKPIEQHQQHFTVANQQQQHYQQQQQHQFQHQQQAHQQQFHQNQQQHTISQPIHQLHHIFQKTDQFFRPSTNTEHNVPTDRLEGYDSIYSDGVSRSASHQYGGFAPSSSYSAQHSANFGVHSAAPTYQNAATAAAEMGGSSFATHTKNRLESSQFSATECGEDCGKAGTQTSSSSVTAQDGSAQYATQSPNHNNAVQGTNSFVANGGSSQHGFAYASLPAAISNGNDPNTSPVPSSNFSPPNNARTASTTSFRYGGNGVAAFTASDRSSISNLGPNDTPPLGSASLRAMGSTSFYPGEASYTDAFLGARRTQSMHHQQFEGNQRNKQLHQFHQQGQQIPQQTTPPSQRHRSMIDEEVLQMPNWGFSTDELDLYRSMPSEEEDKNSGVIGVPSPAPAPMPILPLDHLEDPVMRTFYSSLDGIGPLPTFSPTCSPSLVQPPAPLAKPPLRRPPYQLPTQSFSYPLSPQFYNYNPCPPQREYSVQPIFIALPCYGQSMYQGLASPASVPATTLTGSAMANFLSSTHTQTAMQTPSPIPQGEVRTITTNAETGNVGSKTESSSDRSTTQNVQKKSDSKASTSTTAATTTNEDSNESAESLEDSTTMAPKTSQPKIKGNVTTESDEFKETSSEKPTIVKFDTNFTDTLKTTTLSPIASVEKLGAPSSASTPPSADAMDGRMSSEMSTTFKSLILTARKLAQMVTTSHEEDDVMYKDEISTPKPALKKVRHASRPIPNNNASGGNKRRYMQQQGTF